MATETELIQIDDEVRPMTPEEMAWLEVVRQSVQGA